MKVLITGATGLLGGHLIKELQQRNEEIRALVLPVENADNLLKQGIEVVRGDITNACSLEPAVNNVEVIFHLAGMMGVWRPLADYRLVNVKGSENLYKAAQRAGVRRFVHGSTIGVYGSAADGSLDEDSPLAPDNPYGRTKMAAEKVVREFQSPMEWTTISGFASQGPLALSFAGVAADTALKRFTELTDGKLGQVVIDATGHHVSMGQALQYVGFAGRLVYVGITTQEISFPHPLMHRREMTLLASRNALAPDFARIIRLIEDGRIDTRPWITHRPAFDELIDVFPSYTRPETGVIKAVVAVGE